MYSWIFGEYFYLSELLKMIDEIDQKRKTRRLKGLTMKTTFAEDLKNYLNGIEEIEDVEETKKEKIKNDSEILYSNSKEENENIKMYIENQFKNS